MPVVGVPCCCKSIDGLPFQAVGEKYLSALVGSAEVRPVLLPVIEGAGSTAELLAGLDGVFLTGSLSNVQPHRYDGPAARPGTLQDPRRDARTLDLIPAAIEAGIPLLAVCRGHQELNVALGGTLFQHVNEQPGRIDHRAPKNQPYNVMFAPRHMVRLRPGGLLARLTGAEEILVNSLHEQAIDRLAEGLVAEATAEDGTIEAVRVAEIPGFAMGIQWHPEWMVPADPASRALFAAFGAACRSTAQRRRESRNAA